MRTNRLALGRNERLRRAAGPARFGVRGRLVQDEPEASPVHHARVEVVLDDGRRETFLARGRSGVDGTFQVPLPWTAQALGRSVVVKVLERRPPVVPAEPAERRWLVVARARSEAIAAPETIEVGEVRVGGVRYRLGGAVPRARVDPDAPLEFLPEAEVAALGERWRAGLAAVSAQPWEGAADPVAGIRAALPLPADDGGLDGLLVVAPGRGWSVGPRGPVLRLPEWTEGVIPGAPVPAVEVETEAEGEGLRVVRVAWRAARRAGAVEVDVGAGQPGFEPACAVVAARVRLEALVGDVMGRTWLGLERHALAARRNLRESPVGALVLPHLRDVCRVNELGEAAVFGGSRVLRGLLPVDDDGLAAALRAAAASERWDRDELPARWPGDPRAAAIDAVRQAVRRHVRRTLSAHAGAIEGSWAELAAMAEELVECRAPAPPGDDGAPEPRLTRRRHPEAGDDERLEAWCVAVITRAIAVQGWWRRHLPGPFGAPTGGLRVQWEGDVLSPRVTPRELAQRRLLASAWCLRPEHAAVADLLGELDPALVAELRALPSSRWLPGDGLPSRIAV